MKKKQIMALLLSGTLTLGAVSPVMAAEPAENIPAVETTANTETTAEAVETPKVEKESPTTRNTTPEYPKMMDSLAASLNGLALSVAKDYWTLSDTAKQNVKKLLQNAPESANFLNLILAAYPNGSTSGQIVTVEELQKSLYDEWIKNPNVDMDGLLTSFEEYFVSNIAHCNIFFKVLPITLKTTLIIGYKSFVLFQNSSHLFYIQLRNYICQSTLLNWRHAMANWKNISLI